MGFDMSKNSNSTINWIAAGIGAYFVGSAIAGAIKRAKGIGKVERIKRRIYKEVSLAQDAGVDFSKKYAELTGAELDALQNVGEQVGWKQSKRSIESGKPYTESYYGSLRRAWNAVSGISGIGATSYDVRNANGDVVLTWTDVTDHIQNEPDAKVLLALPPHIEPKKSKARKEPKAKQPSKKDAELLDRDNFATNFMLAYMDGDGYAGVKVRDYISDFWKRDYTINGQTVKIWKLFKWAWANKKYKRSKDGIKMVSMIDGKWYDLSSYGQDKETIEMLDEYYKVYLDDKGWRDNIDRLDDIRRELLDRAPLMDIDLPYEVYDENRDILLDGFATGETRYQFMDYINWIVWVHQHYERGGDTFYPIRAFDTKEDAEKFKRQKYGKIASVKILPIWDVPIEKITGLN